MEIVPQQKTVFLRIVGNQSLHGSELGLLARRFARPAYVFSLIGQKG
jgi:hypothetical protein